MEKVIAVTILAISCFAACFAQSSGAGANFGTKLGQVVEQKVQQKIQPYFPKARTKIDHNTLIILTCAKNLGFGVLQELRPQIEDKFYSSRILEQVGLSLSGVRRIGIGLEHEILVFDLNTHSDGWIPGDRVSGYMQNYPTVCE
jgi:hypothetical protein